MDRLAAALTTRGISIMARIDHAAAVAAIGMELRPTEVLIFGNPRAGTPLMQAVQTVGIDLPLKALVWQDEGVTTWLAYNDPRWLVERHGIDARSEQMLHAMADALAAVAKEATAASAGGCSGVRISRGCPLQTLTPGQLAADDRGTLGQCSELGEGGLVRSRDGRWVQKRCTSPPVSCLR
jgi:uncharacterized protein (DUF302 family)